MFVHLPTSFHPSRQSVRCTNSGDCNSNSRLFLATHTHTHIHTHTHTYAHTHTHTCFHSTALLIVPTVVPILMPRCTLLKLCAFACEATDSHVQYRFASSEGLLSIPRPWLTAHMAVRYLSRIWNKLWHREGDAFNNWYMSHSRVQ